MSFKSFDKLMSTHISLHEPNAFLKKCLNSAFEFFLPHPSAIFAGMDTVALLSCAPISYLSLSGKFLVILYTSKANW